MGRTLAPSKGRSYRGIDPESRKQKRRSALIEAGLELFGTRGYRASSVKMVCEQVGLTERYFYESFANREDLLGSVFDSLVRDLDRRLRSVVEDRRYGHRKRQQRMLEAFFRFIRDDRRRARVMLFEILGVSPDIDRRYQSAVRNLAELFEHPNLGLLPEDSSASEGRGVMSIGLVGAIVQIAIQWVLEDFRTPTTEVERSALKIYTAVASAH
ncbi:TetR/AcrR family transcriptional regulator [Microbulbifer rhizosphaerae]|uniref:AcrR family transcriptional regulator n=1 Tax=Microbulbifer rhizosphaerae TaxID=1562603 RepID=A0A7W4ZBH8_9GAMM|nr:TetR/AcrR family transcriptional regulator [Microbulbifer rhizosphaerae]MBB3063611.1 AcrR family transcriptional regulator [Microbulbifer rhizosphaerae]